MNNTININLLVRLLAQKSTGADEDKARKFTEGFFETLKTALAAGETIKVKGLGTFAVEEKGNEKTTVFRPNRELADKINEPFTAFEAVELEEEAIDDLEALESSENSEISENSENSEISENSENSENSDSSENSENSENSDSSESSENSENSDSSESSENSESSRKSGGMAIWVMLLVGLAIGFVFGYIVRDYIYARNALANIAASTTEVVDEEYSEAIEELDSAIEEAFYVDSVVTETQPEEVAQPAEIVLDTITTTRFLTTISRRHYGGVADFWVYIYLENEAKLGHPDRIAPNTEVVVPPAGKYGIDPASSESRLAARAKAAEIYGRYN